MNKDKKFYEDAIKASEALDLVLTGKNCGEAERAPMCGVPFHSAESYIGRLIEKGYKVAIHSGAKSVHDRELRPMSKEASMRLKCVASVVKVSNPRNNFIFRTFLQPLELLAISIRYGSGYVFKYIFTLIRSYRQLKQCRDRSLDDRAFLDSAE